MILPQSFLIGGSVIERRKFVRLSKPLDRWSSANQGDLQVMSQKVAGCCPGTLSVRRGSFVLSQGLDQGYLVQVGRMNCQVKV